MKVNLEELRKIAEIREWENLARGWQEKIESAIVPGNIPSAIVYPDTSKKLAEVMALAHNRGYRVLPCGGGTKLGWGGLADEIDLVISIERLNRLIEHAIGDLTVTVEAGMKFAELQKVLATAHQFLALDPPYPESATVGGIISTASAGSLRQRYGGVRDMLLGISFVRADGEVAKAGGRVVKNVAGYDLMKLFTGAYGTLGILSRVTLRVYPLPAASRTVVLSGEPEAVAAAVKTLLASTMTPTAIDLLSKELVERLGLGRGIGCVVRFQTIPESLTEQVNRLVEIGQKLGLVQAIFADADETELWQKLKEKTSDPTAILCKVGVKPAQALEALNAGSGIGLIHAGSGLGCLEFQDPASLLKMRQICEDAGGFLSVLTAPATVKQQLDVWGYNGNAIALMQKIKQQFDPQNLLSPNRFVGGN
ncbi:MAG: FAD-binding oxidoreductase [Cyanosarcina radialis HA8281-LM2]|jgi:glycolate oxidase FAD binding subunit|nr:FAD-binding oxidoreductase [Cyanosarcina radialis HA8281-LM2]